MPADPNRKYTASIGLGVHRGGKVPADLGPDHLAQVVANGVVGCDNLVAVLLATRPADGLADCTLLSVDGETGGVMAPPDAFSALVLSLAAFPPETLHPAQRRFTAHVLKKYRQLLDEVTGERTH